MMIPQRDDVTGCDRVVAGRPPAGDGASRRPPDLGPHVIADPSTVARPVLNRFSNRSWPPVKRRNPYPPLRSAHPTHAGSGGLRGYPPLAPFLRSGIVGGDVPVGVVGAGPVGLACALRLASFGICSVVLEADPGLRQQGS